MPIPLRPSHLAGVFTTLLTIAFCSATAQADLTHRYSFKDKAATAVKDSVGHIDAALKGAAKITDGKLVLENGDKTSDSDKLSYVEFGSSVLPKSGSASLVIWITAKENPNFARIFDIGDQDGAEGAAFIYLTPRHEDDLSRAAITATDTGGKTFVTGARLDDGKPHMAALVIDGVARKLHLYVDGKEIQPAQDLGENTLDKVRPVHTWIGRSGFNADPGLSASIEEFRVYDHALSADEVTTTFKAGADTVVRK
jgi:hypothetical protein